MTHVITRLNVELEFPETGQDEASEIQDELMRTYQQLLLQEIERVFDEMVPGNDIILIDHIEVHLGAIEKIEDLPQLIRNSIRNIIMRILLETEQAENGKAVVHLYDEAGNSFTVHAERRSQAMHDELVLFHFLRDGISMAAAAQFSMRERAAVLLKENPAAWSRIIFRLPDFKRLCLQFDESFLRALFSTVFTSGNAREEMAAAFRVLLPGNMNTLFWQTAFETGDHAEDLFMRNLTSKLTATDFEKIRSNIALAPQLAAALLQTEQPEDIRLPRFSSRLIRLLHEWENLLQRQHASALLTSRLLPLKQLLQELAESGSHDAATRETLMQLALLRVNEISSQIAETPLHEALAETAEEIKNELSRVNETTEEPGEQPLYTSQAGMILLLPYLTAFFENIGLLADDEFISDEARYIAVEALHYVVTGEQQSPEEHELVFHKLICGIPLREPLPGFFGLPAAMVEEAEVMFDVFIRNWEALKLTSAAQVRERFLQRNGKLQREDENWFLKVETEPIDVLIDSLPYSLNRMELPWLKAPFFTTW